MKNPAMPFWNPVRITAGYAIAHLLVTGAIIAVTDSGGSGFEAGVKSIGYLMFGLPTVALAALHLHWRWTAQHMKAGLALVVFSLLPLLLVALNGHSNFTTFSHTPEIVY